MTHISKEDAINWDDSSTLARQVFGQSSILPLNDLHSFAKLAIEHYLAEREPLTESQVHSIAQQHHHAGLGINPLNFSRAIEQAHGIGVKP